MVKPIEFKTTHKCFTIDHGEEDMSCFENSQGELWLYPWNYKDYYSTAVRVNYCPLCGKKAPGKWCEV